MRPALFAVALALPACDSPPPISPAKPPARFVSAAAPEELKPDANVKPTRDGVDWPGFLGPNHDSVSPEKGIISPWPKDGLRKVWECELGVGYAPPAVVAGRLFHFDRFENDCRLTCRNAETGQALWRFEYPTDYRDLYGYDAGPRASPVVDGDRVYVHGPEGMLHCVSVADGKEVWAVDTKAKYHFQQNFFGAGSAPLVEGDLVILPVGGSEKGPRPIDFRFVKPDGTGIVAFDKKTGAVKYASGNELASYSSPVVREIGGKRVGLYFARGGLIGFDPPAGKVLFQHKWRARIEESVNASNPLVVGDKILLTECYGPGSVLLEMKNGKPAEVWSDADKDRLDRSLACHWNTPIHRDGFVYGSSGRHSDEGDLRCIELATGDLKWREKRTNRCSLLMADGHLISLGEYGEMRLLKPNPDRYDEVSKVELKELEYPCWAAPVLSRGLLYVRGKGKLLCLELIPKK